MKPIHRSTFLAAALSFCLLGATACGGEEPEPAPEVGQEPVAEEPTSSGPALVEHTVAEEPRPSGMPPAPVLTRITDANEDGTVTIKGVARVEGRVPRRATIEMSHIPGCKSHGPGLTETVLADDEGHLQNVVCLVARGLDAEHFQPLPEEPAVLSQIECMYVPHVMSIRTGQMLLIKNEDKSRHNVNARPWRSANTRFNTMMVGSSPDVEAVFQDQEIAIPFACDIHPWMKAYVAVVDHDFVDITGEDGSYLIEGLPPGKFVLEAWHEEYGKQSLEVEVAAGETLEIEWLFLGKKHKGGRVLPVRHDK